MLLGPIQKLGGYPFIDIWFQVHCLNESDTNLEYSFYGVFSFTIASKFGKGVSFVLRGMT